MNTISVPVRIIVTTKKDDKFVVSYLFRVEIDTGEIERYEDVIEWSAKQFYQFKKKINRKALNNTKYEVFILDKEAIGK